MTKAPRLPSTTQASGIWTLQQALQAIKAGVWPGIPTNTVVLSFTSSGSWTCPDGVSQVDYLVVAGGGGGGGGGGSASAGSGAGAGGFRTGSGLAVIPGTTYTITVGGGGAGVANAVGSNGANSVFSTITSNGGGGGVMTGAGFSGGSGSGGGAANNNGGLGNTPSTTPSQGNNWLWGRRRSLWR